MLKAIFSILVFPGFLFLFIFSFVAEYVDRKLCARFQNRIGPPWFQPLADFIKLVSKEEIIPLEADVTALKLVPVFALTASIAAILYIPIGGKRAAFSFNGDIIVVLYLLTIPTIAYFLGGWYSRSVYSMIGAVRSLIQLFAYEVPLFLCILASALLADTWSLSEMTDFYSHHLGYWFFNILGFAIALISLLGKLEKVPFDIPEAETEIVAGAFTEYGGRLLALLRTSLNIEMVVGASLFTAVFLPFGFNLHHPAATFLLYLVEVFSIIAVITLLRSLFARLRLDQMINFCWKYLAPLALVQVVANLILKGILPR
jgi:NADH-quinone oxidoreductase subunit H